jgi:hypothetical protein
MRANDFITEYDATDYKNRYQLYCYDHLIDTFYDRDEAIGAAEQEVRDEEGEAPSHWLVKDAANNETIWERDPHDVRRTRIFFIPPKKDLSEYEITDEALSFIPSSERHTEIALRKQGEGMQTVGTGHYATVLQDPKNNATVLKIFSNDRGYAEYLRWMVAHQNNKYVPEIIPYEDGSVVKLYKHLRKDDTIKTNERIGILYLRKLEKIANPDVINNFVNYIIGFLSGNLATDIMRSKPPKSLNYMWFFDAKHWKVIAENSIKKDPDLSELATELFRMSVKHGGLDLHNDNLMWDPRRNNIVFIDVLAI